MSGSGEGIFYDSVLKGNAYKEIVKVMLDKSGYSVHPYGYESTLSSVKSKLTKDTRNSKTVRRIRSSPDLLIYDEQKNDLMLVEVKMRKDPSPKIRPRLIRRLKEFWNDSILVLVVPHDNVFYAQKIGELEIKPVYYRLADFEKFQDVFTRVRTEDISHYKDIALQTMKKQKRSDTEEKTMNLDVSIRFSDPKVASEIADAKIADGIKIQRKLTLREMVNPPIDFIISIGANLAVAVAAHLIARFLYDRLKVGKDNRLTINDNSVEINAEKIEQLIINIEKEKKDE